MAIAVLAIGCGAFAGESRMADAVLVKVNGQPIYKREVEKYAGVKAEKMLRAGMELTREREERLLRGALRDLISSRLIRQQALLKRVGVSEDTVDERMQKVGAPDNEHIRRNIKDDILFERLMKRERTPVSEPSPREVREFYLEHRDSFTHPRRVRARHITIPKALPETRSSELRRAKRLRNEAMAEGTVFAELAKRRGGTALDRRSGGLIIYPETEKQGFFFNPKRSDLRQQEVYPTAMLDALEELEKGSVSEVIESDRGFHILYVDEEIPAKTFEFSEVQAKIRQHLFRLARIRLQRKWIARVVDESRVTWRDNTEVAPSEIIPPLPEFEIHTGGP